MYRVHPGTGKILVPHIFEDGKYAAADPRLGKQRHHVANRVVAENIEELREYFHRGWPIWMSMQGTRDRRLISKGIVDTSPPQTGLILNASPKINIASVRDVAADMEKEATRHGSRTQPTESVSYDVAEYLRIISSMSQAEAIAETENPRKLLMDTYVHNSKRLDIAYAPFDHVNKGASIVIVGITPGKQQMWASIEAARRAQIMGLPDAEVLAQAKVHASFAGAMRSNLIKILDALSINTLLGIASTASLWELDSHRAHFTSALRYPTFVNGKNYSRAPDMNRVPFLFNRSKHFLKKELSQSPNAIIIPMGDMISRLVESIGQDMAIPKNRILSGIPHASGANNGSIFKFLHGNEEDNEWRSRFLNVTTKIKSLSDQG